MDNSLKLIPDDAFIYICKNARNSMDNEENIDVFYELIRRYEELLNTLRSMER